MEKTCEDQGGAIEKAAEPVIAKPDAIGRGVPCHGRSLGDVLEFFGAGDFLNNLCQAGQKLLVADRFDVLLK